MCIKSIFLENKNIARHTLTSKDESEFQSRAFIVILLFRSLRHVIAHLTVCEIG